MPVPPSILKSIQAIRKSIASGGVKTANDTSLYLLIYNLFRKPAWIIGNTATLDAVLALAPEIEAYRGKGSQIAAREFNDRLSALVFHARMELCEAQNTDEPLAKGDLDATSHGSLIDGLEKLGSHFFQRVQGQPVRSQLAARLRATAWASLGEISEFSRRPEFLAYALETAADLRSPEVEREGAIQFMVDYWGEEDPDEATAALLCQLEADPPSRSFLVTVLQAQIELGLNDEIAAIFAVDAWDDAEDDGIVADPPQS